MQYLAEQERFKEQETERLRKEEENNHFMPRQSVRIKKRRSMVNSTEINSNSSSSSKAGDILDPSVSQPWSFKLNQDTSKDRGVGGGWGFSSFLDKDKSSGWGF